MNTSTNLSFIANKYFLVFACELLWHFFHVLSFSILKLYLQRHFNTKVHKPVDGNNENQRNPPQIKWKASFRTCSKISRTNCENMFVLQRTAPDGENLSYHGQRCLGTQPQHSMLVPADLWPTIPQFPWTSSIPYCTSIKLGNDEDGKRDIVKSTKDNMEF